MVSKFSSINLIRRSLRAMMSIISSYIITSELSDKMRIGIFVYSYCLKSSFTTVLVLENLDNQRLQHLGTDTNIILFS